jgi:hypothetical protein
VYVVALVSFIKQFKGPCRAGMSALFDGWKPPRNARKSPDHAERLDSGATGAPAVVSFRTERAN